MTTTTQQDALSEHFKPEQIKKLRGFDYVPVGDVIRRMNTVLGTGGWSSQIVSTQIIGDEVVAHVSVTAEVDGRFCHADGFGGVRKNPNGMGDTFKGATSDALKKACQRLGVGLHLAVDDIPEVLPEPQIDVESFKKVGAFIKKLTDEQRAEIATWWATYTEYEYKLHNIDPETWEEFKAFLLAFNKSDVEEAAAVLEGE